MAKGGSQEENNAAKMKINESAQAGKFLRKQAFQCKKKEDYLSSSSFLLLSSPLLSYSVFHSLPSFLSFFLSFTPLILSFTCCSPSSVLYTLFSSYLWFPSSLCSFLGFAPGFTFPLCPPSFLSVLRSPFFALGSTAQWDRRVEKRSLGNSPQSNQWHIFWGADWEALGSESTAQTLPSCDTAQTLPSSLGERRTGR